MLSLLNGCLQSCFQISYSSIFNSVMISFLIMASTKEFSLAKMLSEVILLVLEFLASSEILYIFKVTEDRQDWRDLIAWCCT